MSWNSYYFLELSLWNKTYMPIESFCVYFYYLWFGKSYVALKFSRQKMLYFSLYKIGIWQSPGPDFYFIHLNMYKPRKEFISLKKNFFGLKRCVHCYRVKEKLLWLEEISWLLFTFSSWIRRYWFYVKNDFRNFHQIFTFWEHVMYY